MTFEYIGGTNHPENSRVFVQMLPFVHYKTGANAYMWNDRDGTKHLFFASKSFINKKCKPI